MSGLPKLQNFTDVFWNAILAAVALSFVGATVLAITDAATRPKLLAYGDSIVVGRNLEAPWATQLNARIDAKSGRALADDRDAGRRIASYNPDLVWLAIGTNDFGKRKWAPREFRAAYGRMLDDIHANAPRAVVYAQTPLLRAKETNKAGFTLQAYRDAIWAECSARAWVHCVDGRRILTLSDMPDGLHPGEAAQTTYAAFVRRTFNDAH